MYNFTVNQNWKYTFDVNCYIKYKQTSDILEVYITTQVSESLQAVVVK